MEEVGVRIRSSLLQEQEVGTLGEVRLWGS